jgi:hypothetical protein
MTLSIKADWHIASLVESPLLPDSFVHLHQPVPLPSMYAHNGEEGREQADATPTLSCYESCGKL